MKSNQKDAQLLLELIVRFRHLSIFLELDEKNGIFEVCSRVMTLRYRDLQEMLVGNPGSNILSAAFKCVFSTAASDLDWAQVLVSGSPTSCYEAVNLSEHYCIDILTGSVLLNGRPPARLPTSVLSSPDYRRIFSDKDFIVSVSSTSFPGEIRYDTILDFDGYRYSFTTPAETDDLKIIELETDTNISMELIPIREISHGSNMEDALWISDIPTSLMVEHSHWYCSQEQAIVIRSVNFDDKRIEAVVSDKCYRIPQYLSKSGLLNILDGLDSMDIFVSAPENMVRVLEKLETEPNIHALFDQKQKRMKIELPRFQLQFFLNDQGFFESEQYRGFTLSESQQLPILPFWSQYLLLEHKGSPVKVLTPNGKGVILENKGFDQVYSSLGDDCTHAQHLYVFEWKKYLGNGLSASSLEARLHLSALLVTAGTDLPDSILGMTEYELSIELVRQCWTSNPLTTSERKRVENIILFSGRKGYHAVVLLCENLLRQSNGLSYLYLETPTSRIIESGLLRDAETMYHMKTTDPLPGNTLRQSLNEDEHPGAMNPKTVLGRLPFPSDFRLFFRQMDMGYVSRIERELSERVGQYETTASIPEFPLQHDAGTHLKKMLVKELGESWETNFRLPRYTVADLKYLEDYVQRKLGEVALKKEQVIDFLLRGFNDYGKEISSRHAMLYISNRIPLYCMKDLIRFAIDPEMLGEVVAEKGPVLDAIFHWMELEVLYSKLERIAGLVSEQSLSKLIDELICVRKYDVRKYPRWLALEIEQGIQIRPEQYYLALHLLENPGSVTQLNMVYDEISDTISGFGENSGRDADADFGSQTKR